MNYPIFESSDKAKALMEGRAMKQAANLPNLETLTVGTSYEVQFMSEDKTARKRQLTSLRMAISRLNAKNEDKQYAVISHGHAIELARIK